MKYIFLLVPLLLTACTSATKTLKTPEYLLQECSALPLFNGKNANDLLLHELEVYKLYANCRTGKSNLIFYIKTVEED